MLKLNKVHFNSFLIKVIQILTKKIKRPLNKILATYVQLFTPPFSNEDKVL
jgi:hypothetical protein